jgi:putative ABC transport system ATP-binding protein
MLSLKRVFKTFSTPAGDFTALRGVDLEVEAGQCVALIGRSGSGKSTLLNLVGGIDRPTSGSIVVGGAALESLREAQLARWRGRSVGIVFQFFQLLPTLTVIENVMLPMDFAGGAATRERRRRAEALLERVGIAAHARKLPAELSGGEQQRVAVARALANDPKLVLADEPTGNLDSATGQGVIELLRTLAGDGRTVLVVTHDSKVAGLADRVVTLADGAIADDSTRRSREMRAAP